MTDETNHLIAGVSAGLSTRRDAPFAHLPDGTIRSYGALFDNAAKISGALLAMGVQPGDRVAAQVSKSLTAIELYLGAVSAGAVFLPLNTAYTGSEIEYFLSDAEPRVFVTDPGFTDRLAKAAQLGVPEVLTLDASGAGTLSERAAASAPVPPVARGANDLAAILYTSGTTGRAKGAMLSHGNLRSNSETLAKAWAFTGDDVLIHALPIFHTHGLFVATNVSLIAGASTVFLPGFDAEAILDAMPRATALMGVPTFYTRLLQSERLAEASRGMRLFVSGSAPLLEETHRAWQEATGQAILERYGMTETNMNISNPYDGERRPGSVGQPLPGVTVRLAGPDGSPVAQGEPGVIEVHGPNVFQGYWRMPEKTAEEFREDGFFITGDIAVESADGYISIVGRAKDMIISGGFNVYPKEVELLIDAVPGVLESAVIGVPHADFGEGVVAIVVLEGAVDADAIAAAIAPGLARYKQPKAFRFVDALPRNAMGKVQKAELRKSHADIFAA